MQHQEHTALSGVFAAWNATLPEHKPVYGLHALSVRIPLGHCCSIMDTSGSCKMASFCQSLFNHKTCGAQRNSHSSKFWAMGNLLQKSAELDHFCTSR